jgi:hypothetical protein
MFSLATVSLCPTAVCRYLNVVHSWPTAMSDVSYAHELFFKLISRHIILMSNVYVLESELNEFDELSVLREDLGEDVGTF